MTTIEQLTLEVDDTAAAEAFYARAFDLGDTLQVREAQAPSTGFRGYSLSLVVAQPSTVDDLVGSALEAGATTLKSPRKSLWGYGGVVQAPDGTVWKAVTSSKKEVGAPARQVDDLVVLMGVDDVKASKQFYVGQGLGVGKSFGAKYVELETGPTVKLSLYGRRAAAKDAGVPDDGSGSHRIVIGSDAGSFTDPDGYIWESL